MAAPMDGQGTILEVVGVSKLCFIYVFDDALPQSRLSGFKGAHLQLLLPLLSTLFPRSSR